MKHSKRVKAIEQKIGTKDEGISVIIRYIRKDTGEVLREDITRTPYGGPQCLDTNGAFLRFEKDCFRLPESNPLFQNTPYQESILPEKHVA
jgi:hypothetical protein